MDLSTLNAGDKVRTVEGALALVLSASDDGRWIKVRYLESLADPGIVGTEDLCHEDELEDLVDPK